MGSKGGRGARSPSHTAYYVALGVVLGLLLLLCTYFVYYCIRRVKELTEQGLPERAEPRKPAPAPATAYPVQPEVRASASAMARLCQSPASCGGPSARVLLSPSRERFISAHRSGLSAPAAGNAPPRSRATPARRELSAVPAAADGFELYRQSSTIPAPNALESPVTRLSSQRPVPSRLRAKEELRSKKLSPA